jgi:polyribonucleotide nucleotidyltransferase
MIIGKEFIGAVIGPGGKIIQGIQEKTGATVSIDEVDGVGKIEISGTNKATIDAAVKAIKGIVAERFMKERFPLSCLMARSLSSCRARMVCFTFPRSIGNVWRPLSKPA